MRKKIVPEFEGKDWLTGRVAHLTPFVKVAKYEAGSHSLLISQTANLCRIFKHPLDQLSELCFGESCAVKIDQHSKAELKLRTPAP
jgi:hypothetical protein